MRIIGGEYRSRLISMPKGVRIRPTQDKVRQAVFNLIGSVEGRRALDIFAGSGAFGIEALSRGALHAGFVDDCPRCLETIRDNIASLGINRSGYDIIRADGLKAAERLAVSGEKFDIVFIDPPYHRDMARICLINVDSCDILSPAGLVVVEHHVKDILSPVPERLCLKKEKRYGDTAVSIFGKNSEK